MRRLLLVIVLLTAAMATGCGGQATTRPAPTGPATTSPATASPATSAAPPGAHYYLALGDSLAQGVQADAAGRSVETRRGYADQLYAALRRSDPGLRLVKLGCPGETTGTMISGRHCPYRAGSQLAAAVRFLRAHPDHVSLITIDIGANDPDSCFTWPVRDQIPPCARGPRPSTTANLTKILAGLRAAAGHWVRIIGMSYYAPELAEWRYGPAEHAVARLSARRALAFGAGLARVYASFDARVADVSGAFATADFGGRVPVPRLGSLPRNVAAVCRWTWACAAPPRGPNKHPNAAGYAVIARAFVAADRR